MAINWLKNNLVLILILGFSLFIYTYKLNSLPPLYTDEAIEGYNALSIWQTGKDEYGQPFPLAFRLFGAYTPPLYIYLISPIIGLFGATVFNIRILSAISGVISVFFIYKTLSLYLNQKFYLLVSTFLFSILPWTVFNSRLGYEVILATTLFNIGVYLLLAKKKLYWALLFISLSTYTAHTQKYLAPIFLLFFLRLNFKNILFLLFTQIPNLWLLTTPSFWVKTNNFSISSFFTQFVNYLSPYTLFFQPQDIDKQHLIPQIGLYFWWMIIPLIIGLKKAPKELIYWCLIAIIPACLSGNFISIQRTLPLLVPLMIIISLGLQKINKLFLILLCGYSFLLLYRSYFKLLPHEMGLSWNYGYSELTKFIKDNPDKKFVIDNNRNQGSYSTIIYLLNYPPSKYQKEIDQSIKQNYYQAPNLDSKYKFNTMWFRKIDWETDECQPDYVVGDELAISKFTEGYYHLKLVNTITTPNNQVALKIFSTRKGDTLCR